MKTTKFADICYDVVKEPLFTPDGKSSGLFCTRRTDTGEVFEAVSSRYGVLSNRDLVETVQSVFQDKGIQANPTYYILNGGAKMIARFELLNREIKVPNVGDICNVTFDCYNSFDLTKNGTLSLGLKRLVCSNGMMTTSSAFHCAARHTSGAIEKLSTDLVSYNIDKALDRVNSEIEIFGDMSKIKLSLNEGNAVVKHLEEEKLFSNRKAWEISSIWRNNPIVQSDNQGERTMWRLYNSITQVLSHNFGTPRILKSNDIGVKVTETFARLSRDSSELNMIINAALN